jgi:predicted acylesterase/phospholipase RssA
MLKRILYYCPEPSHLEDLLGGLGQYGACRVDRAGELARICCNDHDLELVVEHEPCAALDRLHQSYFNLVLIDLRNRSGETGRARAYVDRVMCLLEAMASEKDIEARFGFHRVLALVAGPESEEIDQLIVELGARGVAHVLRDSSACHGSADCPEEPRRSAFFRHVIDRMMQILGGRRRGKRALCASGGGTTAIYFELGALKCLDDCFGSDAINTFDLYFGISAGAVVSGLLAAGYRVEEIMAAIAGYEGGRIPPLSLSLFKWPHVNFGDYRRRLGQLTRQLGSFLVQLVRRQAHVSLDAVLVDYTDLLAPPFHGRAFERMLREILTREGAANDFRTLRRPLYIGATDQDTRTHVLFGDEGWEDVPISQAIVASMSINPALRSTEIRGRFYEDGGVTRTSNFMDAIAKGADLVIVLNPFVPYVAKDPGYAEQRGLFYNVDQDIRAMTYTRFENKRDLALHHHPQVSSYTFLPANRLRKLMSANPLDHRPFLTIWRGAYLSTLMRVIQLRYRMAGDARTHGLTLDTSRAEAVAERLTAAREPTFADFFPDRRVEFRGPPPPPEHSLAAPRWPSPDGPAMLADEAAQLA